MDWQLVLTIGVQLVTVGIVYGIIKTRLDVLERDVAKIDREVIDFRSLREDMAVVKTQLTAISACLNNLARNYKEHPDA